MSIFGKCFVFSVIVASVRGQGCYVPGNDPPVYTSSPVFCTSETEFVIPSGDIVLDSADVIPCPDGLICADHPEICVSPSDAEPACMSTVRSCNNCENNARYACVGANEFAVCVNKKPSAFKQTCPLKAPICGFTIGTDRASATWPCTTDKMIQSCSECSSTTEASQNITASTTSTSVSTTIPILNSTLSTVSSSTASTLSSTDSTTSSSSSTSTTTITISPLAACNNRAGTFALTTDSTCKAYVYCYLEGTTLKRTDYTCPGTYVFNPSVKKCVAPALYTCPS